MAKASQKLSEASKKTWSSFWLLKADRWAVRHLKEWIHRFPLYATGLSPPTSKYEILKNQVYQRKISSFVVMHSGSFPWEVELPYSGPSQYSKFTHSNVWLLICLLWEARSLTMSFWMLCPVSKNEWMKGWMYFIQWQGYGQHSFKLWNAPCISPNTKNPYQYSKKEWTEFTSFTNQLKHKGGFCWRACSWRPRGFGGWLGVD